MRRGGLARRQAWFSVRRSRTHWRRRGESQQDTGEDHQSGSRDCEIAPNEMSPKATMFKIQVMLLMAAT